MIFVWAGESWRSNYLFQGKSVRLIIAISAYCFKLNNLYIQLTYTNLHPSLIAEAKMTRTSLFQSNKSQAVRLPKAVAFPQDVHDVRILKDGKRRIIVPANAVWDDFFDHTGVDLPDRIQPEANLRNGF